MKYLFYLMIFFAIYSCASSTPSDFKGRYQNYVELKSNQDYLSTYRLFKKQLEKCNQGVLGSNGSIKTLLVDSFNEEQKTAYTYGVIKAGWPVSDEIQFYFDFLQDPKSKDKGSIVQLYASAGFLNLKSHNEEIAKKWLTGNLACEKQNFR